MKTTDAILREAAQTFAERAAVYKDNNPRAAAALVGLFPDGVTLRTQADFERFILFSLLVVKLSRYAVQWQEGHQDSIRDAAVYAAMMEALDGNRGQR